ncbi:indole-3-glycerol phosphate synthase TrpC [Leifsonia bigeumensis]|uniref:indole-3-glycerol-phosphate synthase n=1 Tax=Leifsonella bigeumensis TaxID=433643 RepID=A0ABP7FQ70_9MICO
MLSELIAGAVADASARRAVRSQADVERAALDRAPALDALAALAPADRVKIIAEVKRASPSRGALADIPDPAALAARYETGGASAISVLTEGRRFGGSLEDLEAVRARVSLPVLRKDFIVLPYQVFEARAAGADLVLLMASALEQADLVELYALVTELGMTALVEAHDAEEVARAVDLGASVIGINARNLSTFELDPGIFPRLVDRLPSGTIRVAESAVKTAADVARYREAGADVVLVGEALVTGDPVATLTEFLAG